MISLPFPFLSEGVKFFTLSASPASPKIPPTESSIDKNFRNKIDFHMIFRLRYIYKDCLFHSKG